jgi:phosphoribosyl 1,2-cyclic phosphodiesterase
MGIRFCMLGSGSGGNCSLLDTGKTRLLIDCARLGQRYIKDRLEELGTQIDEIDGILATHMHGDHIDGSVTFPLCRKHDIPLYVHHDSITDLMRRSDKFAELDRAGLVRRFRSEPFALRELWIRPIEVTHGAGGWNRDIVGRPVGFRVSLFEGATETAVAYATDLGGTNADIEEAMAGADILALESNHDVEIERHSARPRFLVDWVLGPRGHLSNAQAAAAIGRIVSRGEGRTRNIVLAHLSEECNTPDLATTEALRALNSIGSTGVSLYVAQQREPSPEIIA